MNKIIIILILLPFLYGFNWWGSKINKGNQLYKTGKNEEALKLYRDAQIDNPQNPLINYNLGNALAALNKHPEAESEFLKALQTTDRELEAKTYYNLGNSHYREGKYDQAIKMYEQALDINPQDEDAKYNIELVRKKIKEMMANQEKRQAEQQAAKPEQKQNKEPEKDKQEKASEKQAAAKKEAEKKEAEKKSGEPDKDKTAPEEKQAGLAASKNKGEEMSQEDALRILNALNQDEKDLMRNRQELSGSEAPLEKDW